MNDSNVKKVLDELERQNQMLENLERKQKVASMYLFVILLTVIVVPIVMALPF